MKKEALLGFTSTLSNKFSRDMSSFFLFWSFAFSIFSCQSKESYDYKKAVNLVNEKRYAESLILFEKITKRGGDLEVSLRAAKEAGRVSQFEAKDFVKAISFYRFIVLNSASQEDRLLSQRAIATIYFDHLQDYPSSIREFNKLLPLIQPGPEKGSVKLKLARAYYYLGNFDQSQIEISELLKTKISEDDWFDTNVLLGNLLIAKKKFYEASSVFRKVVEASPERALKENIYLSLSMSLEEEGKFSESLQTLERIMESYQPREYLELRIKRLKERQKNQPGAQGFRK